jgi:transglutaminase-like putative cysteine protease
MKISKRIPAVLLSAAILVSVLPIPAGAEESNGNMANIGLTEAYTAGQFPDVDEGKWYGEENQQVVGTACRLGLMRGNGSGFAPGGAVTLAEAVAMAARLNNLYYGSPVTFSQGAVWYQVYVDYAVSQGIIGADDFQQQYTRAATRAEMAYLFANALPAKEYSAISTAEILPDVDGSTHYVDSIYLLYRAGVLTGDEIGAFHPETSIDRASAAAILSRVALPEMRKTFVLNTSDDFPVWENTYSEQMWVGSLDALIELYAAAVLNRIDSFSVRTSEDVVDQFLKDGVIFNFNVDEVYFEYDYKYLTVSITYSTFGEVEALWLSEGAAGRASDEAKSYSALIDKLRNSILEDDMTDLEKCRAIHDYMTKTYSYDQSPDADSYSFTGLLDSRQGVCQAYAELFYLLATRADVYCALILGTADGTGTGNYMSHAWNIVYVEHQWYHIDVTFDDPLGGRGIYTDYFMLTENEILKDHTW